MPRSVPPAEPGDQRRTGGLAATLVGLVAALVSVTGSWVPSAWVDEAATMSAANRTLPQLWHMVQNVDAVHGLYYAAVHLWFQVVPYSPFTLRLPSAVGVGLAAALTVFLTRRFAGTWAGIVAGLVFAVLPRVTFVGADGRSYAWTTATAVAAMLVLCVAVERTDRRAPRAWLWWVGYVAVTLFGAFLFLYTALSLAAHGITVLVWAVRRWRRQGWAAALRPAVSWLAAAVLSALVLLPFVRLTSGEAAKQLYFLGPLVLDRTTLEAVATKQWFGGTVPLAVLFAVTAVVAVVSAVAVPRLRTRLPLVELLLPIVVVPTVVVVVVSLLVRPLYIGRYFTFCAPAVAILIALGLVCVRWKVVGVLGVALAVVLAFPRWQHQRDPGAKQGARWDEVAALVARERAAEPAGTRDGVFHGPLPGHANRTTEFIATTYPDAFRGMRDLTVTRPAVAIGELWAERLPVDDPAVPTDGVDRVWWVGVESRDQPRIPLAGLEHRGWHVVERHRAGGVLVVVMARS
ncbi:glycosyltransferase family 39 protein [Curtobacterium luteum]|uniref:glycosyltransferase family 39 protein n=1 Tax=Curtobacterium luteum TaxID=33881 RepID=UPI0007377488|nr:hypothetical protein [Curtobacterium luteum]